MAVEGVIRSARRQSNYELETKARGKGASPSVSGLLGKGGREYLLFLITAALCG